MLLYLANASLDSAKHTEALWRLQARIYNDQPYVFLYSTKNKIAIHKRFDNRNTYFERPGIMLNNLKLIEPTYSGGDKIPNVVDLEDEENPALGLRGIRMSLTYPDLFFSQLKDQRVC